MNYDNFMFAVKIFSDKDIMNFSYYNISVTYRYDILLNRIDKQKITVDIPLEPCTL